MDLADDVAYSVHDVEDGVVADRLDLGVLRSREARAEVAATAARWYGLGLDGGAVEAALLRLQALPEWVEGFDGSRRALAALKTMTSGLIGRFAQAADEATRARYGDGPLTRHAADLVVPEDTLAEVVALKAVAAHYVMSADERLPVYAQQQELLAELVDALLMAGGQVMQPPYAADLADAADDDAALRVVVDQVAALTDTSAVVWHRGLVN
jgi:dGTPase